MHLFYKARKFHETFLMRNYYQKWIERFSHDIEFNVRRCFRKNKIQLY